MWVRTPPPLPDMKRLTKKKKIAIAEAIGKRLELCDWTVYDRHKLCPKCNKYNIFDGKYCAYCTGLLPLRQERVDQANEELLEAFKLALKEYERK